RQKVMQLITRHQGVGVGPNGKEGDESQVEKPRITDHKVETDGKARIHRAGGQDSHPELGTGPGRVVLDVLQQGWHRGGHREEGNEHLWLGERLVPPVGARFPEPFVPGGRLDLNHPSGRLHARSVSGCPKSPWGRTRSTTISARKAKAS